MQLVGGDTQIIDAPTRNPIALQSRLSGLVRPDVALFASCLAVVNNEHHSGWTDRDYMNEAQNRFTAKREQLNANALREFKEQARSGTVKTKAKTKPRVKPEIFRLHHCHDVLRQSVRFMRDVPQPRKRPRVTNELEGSEDEASDNVELTLDTDIADNGDDMVPGIRDSFQSPGQVGSILRPSSAGEKKAKQLQLEGQVDKAIMHSQRELAIATTAQVSIMKEQLEVSKRKVVVMENQQQVLREKAEVSIMCASMDGLSEFGKEYLLLKQKQLLKDLKRQTRDD